MLDSVRDTVTPRLDRHTPRVHAQAPARRRAGRRSPSATGPHRGGTHPDVTQPARQQLDLGQGALVSGGQNPLQHASDLGRAETQLPPQNPHHCHPFDGCLQTQHRRPVFDEQPPPYVVRHLPPAYGDGCPALRADRLGVPAQRVPDQGLNPMPPGGGAAVRSRDGILEGDGTHDPEKPLRTRAGNTDVRDVRTVAPRRTPVPSTPPAPWRYHPAAAPHAPSRCGPHVLPPPPVAIAPS